MVGANVPRSSSTAVSSCSAGVRPAIHVRDCSGVFGFFAAGKQSGSVAGFCLNFARFADRQLSTSFGGYFSTRGRIADYGS